MGIVAADISFNGYVDFFWKGLVPALTPLLNRIFPSACDVLK